MGRIRREAAGVYSVLDTGKFWDIPGLVWTDSSLILTAGQKCSPNRFRLSAGFPRDRRMMGRNGRLTLNERLLIIYLWYAEECMVDQG